MLLQNLLQAYGVTTLLPLSPAAGSVSTLFCSTTTPPSRLRKHQHSTQKTRHCDHPSSQSSDLLNLKSLTSRVVQLTRRRQLSQIFEEIEIAKKQHGKLNMIVMNAVMQACVHCHDVESALLVFAEMSDPDGCGVDNVTYGTLLKGLGNARRIDEAFQILESVEQGDLRRANGLLARYGYVLQEGGSPSICTFNMLMKGYIAAGYPQAALALHDEILRHGLNPDRLSYNTLISACIKQENLDAAMLLFEQMKDKAQNSGCDVFPDLVTYTTLLQGFGQAKDVLLVGKILVEMKSCNKLRIDRVAYAVIIDALLNCGLTRGALCVFGEIMKQAERKPVVRPKPHLFLSMMRAFSSRGDYNMVRRFRERMWFDSAGTITMAMQVESDHLLVEAALNQGRFELAVQKYKKVVGKWRAISWSSRSGLVALRLEALMGFNTSILSPRVLPEVSLRHAIEDIMIPFHEASPIQANLQLKQVVMRFFKNPAVPVIDEGGGCVGILHREDCDTLDAPVSSLMRSPPPYVTGPTSVGYVIDLMLEKRYKMVVIVKYRDSHGIPSTSSLRALGVFTYEQLCKFTRNS